MPKQSHSQVYNLRKPLSQKDMCTPIFNTLFTISRTQKQTKCPSTDEWIKMWYMYIHKGILLSLYTIENSNWRRHMRLPWWLSGKESAWHCRRHGFHPWSGRISGTSSWLSPCTATIEPVLWGPGTTTAGPTCCNRWGSKPAGPGANALRSPCTPTRE